jgi:hypothetical protein
LSVTGLGRCLVDDTLCPRCRAEKIRPVHVIRREEVAAVFPYCDACGWVVGQALTSLGAERGGVDGADRLVGEQVRHLAHWEPRDRLPTPEEEAAHTAKHGAEAGWMANQGMGWHSVDDAAEMEILRGFVGESWRSYPHVDGRPVGWPEVKP